MIYVGTDYNISKFNKSGTLLWTYLTGAEAGVSVSSFGFAPDGTIYASSYDNNIYALNSNGTLKWQFATGGPVEATPVVGEDGTIYVGSFDNSLYAINPDGSLKASFATGDWIRGSAAIGLDGTVYIGSQDAYLYALTSNLNLKWSYFSGSSIKISPTMGMNELDGIIYISTYSGDVKAIHAPFGYNKNTWSMYRGSPSHIGNAEIDTDGDGMSDMWENNYGLNPTLSSDANTDTDSDGLMALDEYYLGSNPNLKDTDNDGLDDFNEKTNNTNPTLSDTDNDGMPDGYEVAEGLDPLANDADANADTDTLTNIEEYQIGTSASNPDTDGDQIPDDYEQNNGLNPLLNDAALDLDGDLYSNYQEFYKSTDPNNINIFPGAPGTALWTYLTGDIVRSTPAISEDGTVYFASYDRNVYAVGADGVQKWSYQTSGQINSSPAIDSDGVIYIGTSGGSFYAINPNGTSKWVYSTGNFIWGSAAIGVDGTIYVGNGDGSLFAFNPDGTLRWTYETGTWIYSSATIDENGTIYVVSSYEGASSTNGYLHALNSDGTLKWRFLVSDYGGYGDDSSPTIGSDGTIYVGSNVGNIYAVSPNGVLKWSYKTGYFVWSSAAIGADGTIYIASMDKNVYALNPDGSIKWTYTTNGYVYSSPAIGMDGTIFIGSDDGNLYALNVDGSEKWRYPTGDSVRSSPVIGLGGAVYVGSDNGILHVVRSVSGGQEVSNWSKFRGNLNNTGLRSDDIDNDGLPDSWEMQYFSSLVYDANGNPDGDGLTNIEEFRFNKNPVLVTDTEVPVLTVPADITVEASGVNTVIDIGAATATDDIDTSVFVFHDAPTEFPLGKTIVTWMAIDSEGNVGTAKQIIWVRDTTSSEIVAPASITLDVTSNTPISLDIGYATATDIFQTQVTNDAPELFLIGDTVVTWTATDENGNVSTASQTIAVTNIEAPIVTPIQSQNNRVDQEISLHVIATDVDVLSYSASNLPEGLSIDSQSGLISGALTSDSLGTRNINITVTDGNNPVTIEFTWEVNQHDYILPVVVAPADLMIEANAVLTIVDLGNTSANDNLDGTLTAIPSVSGPFGLGTHQITWSATDADGNIGTATQTIIVQDTTPPQLTVPSDIVIDASTIDPVTVDIGIASAEDIFSYYPIVISNNAPSLFSIGETIVTWSATDVNGNSAYATQTVTVNLSIPDGDINLDGEVNVVDVLLGFRALHGKIVLTAEQLAHADVAPLIGGVPAPDGNFNIGDMVVIQRKALGVITY